MGFNHFRMVVWGLVGTVVLLACSRGLTPEEQRQIEVLQTELVSVKQEISAAEQESKQYTGGLIRVLVDTRLEILKTNDALLRQRISAIQSHSPVTIQTVATIPDEGLAQKLETEIKEQEAKLTAAENEAKRYTGGLVQAMALTTAATQSQTLAMLRQRYLIAKLGLALPKYATQTNGATPTVDAVPPTTVSVPPPAATSKPHSENVQDQIVQIALLKKTYSKQDYQEYVFFDVQYQAAGLDKSARAIKGKMHLTDLFGETKLSLNWSIDKPIKPGESVDERGTGFKYNQFKDDHQWAKATALQDMKATFTVTNILYEDGTRRDFE